MRVLVQILLLGVGHLTLDRLCVGKIVRGFGGVVHLDAKLFPLLEFHKLLVLLFLHVQVDLPQLVDEILMLASLRVLELLEARTGLLELLLGMTWSREKLVLAWEISLLLWLLVLRAFILPLLVELGVSMVHIFLVNLVIFCRDLLHFASGIFLGESLGFALISF